MKNHNCKKNVLIIVSGRSGTVGGPRVSSNRIVNSGLAKKYNFSLLEVPRLRRLIMPKSIYTTMKKINEFRPDLIQVNGLQLDGFIITVLMRIIAGNKILLAIRGSSNEAIYYSKLLKSMTRPLEILTIILSYKVFTNSRYTFNWDIIKRYAKNKLYGIIYNMPPEIVNVGRYFRKEMGLTDSDILIVSSGRITRDKGFHILMNVITEIGYYENVKYIIVGEGEYLANIRKMIIDKKIKNIICTGHRNDIIQILLESNIFVLCSLHETLCNSVMEASYVGLPVVSSKVGGIPEIISHGENGYLVENNSIDEYKKYLDILINDMETRERLSDNAIRISRSRFSKDKIEEKLDELYQDCFRKK